MIQISKYNLRIYTLNHKLSTSSSKMDKGSLIEWIPQWTRSSDTLCYGTTTWVAGEKWSRGSWQQHKHLPCFGHLSWPLHYNTAALQGTNSPISSLTPKNNSPRSEPNHFTKPVHSTAPSRCAAHPGWVRLPKVGLLKKSVTCKHCTNQLWVPWHFAFLCFCFPSLHLFRP